MKKLDSLDYGLAMKKLLQQTFSYQRYKEIGLPFAITLGILLSLLYIPLGVLLLAFIFVFVAYKIILSPIEYLTTLIHKEGADVKHATQFAVYFIGFPTVFVLNVFMAFISVFLFILFLFISVICELISLGGTQFAPFINDQPQRTLRKPLEEPKFNAIFDVTWLGTFTFVGAFLEILNRILLEDGKAFGPTFIMFLICYIVGVSIMGFEKRTSYKTTLPPYEASLEDEEVVYKEVVRETKKETSVNENVVEELATTKKEDEVVFEEPSDDIDDDFEEYKED